MEQVMEPAGLGADEVQLDPYAHQPGIRSRIAGLASGSVGVEPNYVFHTDYVPMGRGHVDASIRFSGLSARAGTLLIRVHLLRHDAQPALVLVTSERIQLNRLVQNGGELTIRFEAFNNCLYALFGMVIGDTDAAADGLQVVVRRPVEIEGEDYHTEARNSAFGQGATRQEQLLVSTRVPTLAAPVTQVATLEQLESPLAKALIREADLPDTTGSDAKWSLAYTLRCLETYGMLGPNARGLCQGDRRDPVAKLLQRRSIAVDCLYDAEGRQALAPSSLANYDFLWRFTPSSAIPSKQDWCDGVERSLKALLPGGLAIFTFGYDPTPPIERPREHDGASDIDRTAVERLALLMVSRNHEVAQVRMAGDFEALSLVGGDAPSIAGFVMRRAQIAH